MRIGYDTAQKPAFMRPKMGECKGFVKLLGCDIQTSCDVQSVTLPGSATSVAPSGQEGPSRDHCGALAGGQYSCFDDDSIQVSSA